jgi:uncharacterized protein
MIIDLRELRLNDEPLEIDKDFTNSELVVDSELFHLESPIASHVVISLRGDCVRVAGHLRGSLSMTCCRCSKPIFQPVDKDFLVDYWPDPVSREGEELRLNYDDLEVGFYHGDEFDLSAVISEQIVLEVPMKPVCRENCKGLCDQCGADLELGPCSCERNRIDPRLSALAEYRKKLN